MDLNKPYLVIEKNIPTIFKCLRELDPEAKVKFCIFTGEKEFTIKTRRENRNKFNPICPILNIENNDIIFIHKAGFLAKTKTLEAAKLLVNTSLLDSINFPDLKETHLDLEIVKDKRVIGGLALTSLAALGFLYWNQNE